MARWLALLATLAAASIGLPAPAALAAPPVTNTNDSGPGSLRNAIDNASASDTITVPPGEYRLTSGQLVIDNATSLDLIGSGGDSATRIVATGAFRVICIAGGVNVNITGLTISGGRGAAGGACGDGQGGGIHDTGTGSLTLSDSTVQGNSATATQGGGGGIYKEVGDLSVQDTAVRGNSSTATSALGSNGGGGIRWTGTGLPSFVLENSEISGNTATVAGPASGGGGIYTQASGPRIANVTLSDNRLSLAGPPGAEVGGGAVYARDGGGLADHATVAFNAAAAPGSAIASGAATDVGLSNSIVYANNSPACSPGDVTSLGGNVDGAATCGTDAADRPNTDPMLGPLAENGSSNGTRTHELPARSNPAVEFGVSCLGSDQRGVNQFGDDCDSGAYEYDGRASASVPPCSATGNIPVNLDDPPGGDVEGLIYTLDDGPVQSLDTGPPRGGPFTTTLRIAEGRHRLVYWGQWTNGIEKGRNAQDVLVDQTRPSVAVENPAPFRVFVIKRRVSVNVKAGDALSGLVTDPSGRRQIDTGRRGTQRFAPTAVDLCANQAAAPFDYRVLAPGLGIRTVLERIRGTVVVRPAGGTSGGAGATASQKGRSFTALREPRELRVGSLIDTRRGTARLTS